MYGMIVFYIPKEAAGRSLDFGKAILSFPIGRATISTAHFHVGHSVTIWAVEFLQSRTLFLIIWIGQAMGCRGRRCLSNSLTEEGLSWMGRALIIIEFFDHVSCNTSRRWLPVKVSQQVPLQWIGIITWFHITGMLSRMAELVIYGRDSCGMCNLAQIVVMFQDLATLYV